MTDKTSKTELQTTLTTLKNHLKTEANLIYSYVFTNGSKFESEVFDAPQEFDCTVYDSKSDDRIIKIKERKGIYIFVAKKSFDFNEEKFSKWNNCTGAPLILHNNGTKAFTVTKGKAFYVGSCYDEKLCKRLEDHCTEKDNVTKASLKLGHDSRKWVKQYLKIYCFLINENFDKTDLRIILPEVEKELHTKCSPVAGRSKT